MSAVSAPSGVPSTTAPSALTLDPTYVGRIAERMQRIERSEISARQQIQHTKEGLDRAVGDIVTEMAALREELKALDADTALIVDRVKRSIGAFKHVVKRGDMARLQSRVDMWSPETRITREQFRRLIAQR